MNEDEKVLRVLLQANIYLEEQYPKKAYDYLSECIEKHKDYRLKYVARGFRGLIYRVYLEDEK